MDYPIPMVLLISMFAYSNNLNITIFLEKKYLLSTLRAKSQKYVFIKSTI